VQLAGSNLNKSLKSPEDPANTNGRLAHQPQGSDISQKLKTVLAAAWSLTEPRVPQSATDGLGAHVASFLSSRRAH
jgi:hypothetical protein